MRITDFDFLVDKLRVKLSGWAASSLSTAGCITLDKSVLAAIPSFFMQTTRLPIAVCSEIDKIRALSSVWDSVRENICWLVGNGSDVHILDDIWVPFLGPLRQWLRLPDHGADNLHFHDLLVHNAYSQTLEPLWVAVDSKWSHLWSLPVTERIRLFLWLVLCQRLMTNEERRRRRLSFDPSCPSCGCVQESILHVLRDYPPNSALMAFRCPQEQSRKVLFFLFAGMD
ncbi:hypothetical protein V6N11_076272 [Hibiscus sabdariffa]|uniref:Reverse transcriptase zinc-binding domain-containing protein n=1 Tax=Hibiscus sabdariffa TaxID=183260 RepID=A0ABR2Q5R5_9ROSI